MPCSLEWLGALFDATCRILSEKKPVQKRTREGVLVTTLDLLDLAVPDAAPSFGPPHLKPHISLCCNTRVSWASSLASEGPVRMPFSGALAVSSVWVVEKGSLGLGGGAGRA